MSNAFGLENVMSELKDTIQGNCPGIVMDGCEKHIVFLSLGNPDIRANVCKGIGSSFAEGWTSAVAELEKRLKKLKLRPSWVKADVVSSVKEFALPEFLKYISKIKTNYFREGIAFDKRFKVAFLEQEVNANVFICENKEKTRKNLIWKNINYYVKRSSGLNLLLCDDVVDKVYTFKTLGVFHDGEKCHQLCNDWLNNGRRHIDGLAPELVHFVISKSSEYLCHQVYKTGQFRYGYFPCFNKEIPHYNILRHSSTTYSMIDAYEITKSEELKQSISRALGYLIREGIKFVTDCDGNERAFVIEKSDNYSIKLGANAAAVLALAKYTEVFADKSHLPIMRKLAEGILYFQNQEGAFVHVLNYPDLSVREAHRIIYYDGEAAFALMRLYAIDKQPKWIQAVEKASDHFLNNSYWRYNDHWLSYCSYELFLHRPDKRYLEFNLRNAEGILDFCLTRETTYATLLELLMACAKIIDVCYSRNLYIDLLSEFDQGKLNEAIHHRAENQLNGFLFPEVAMYFKEPKNIMWGFYIRHHSFRVRIDDVEHNLSGYCSYYRKLESLST